MNDEREQDVRELFEAAMKLEPRKRAAFIEVACSDDNRLKEKLHLLITSQGAQSHPDGDHITTNVADETNPLGTVELSPESLAQLQQLLDAVAALNGKERDDFLAETCAGDAALRVELLERLAAQDDSAAGDATVSRRPTQSLVGQQLNCYLIERELGRGGMGIVYLAQDTRLGRRVALKLLPSALTADSNRVRRFKQEARAASALNHPNILTIYDIDEIDSRPIIVAEYIEGETVRQLIRSLDITPSRAVDIAMQIARALSAAHEAGIIHRDIKSENIMVRRDGYVKVVDFGLAKLAEKQPTKLADNSPFSTTFHTNPGVVLGTTSYMSPEQARGKELDARSDIFSLGVVMYEMFTGEKPFDGETASDIIVKILSAEPAPLADYARDLPDAAQHIVSKALHKERDQRYQNAGELLSDLEELKEELALKSRQSRSASGAKSSSDARQRSANLAAQPTGEIAMQTAPHSAADLAEITKQARKIRWLMLATSLLLVLLIAVAVFVWRSRTASRLPSFDNVQLANATLTGKTDVAAISPDGKYLAYTVAEANGRQSLQLKQLVANNSKEIAAVASGYYGGLTFSRDSNFIYYVVVEAGYYRRLSLYQVPVFGGSERKLLDNVFSPVTFSPDGKEFAFVRRLENGATSLVIASADGSSERSLATYQSPERFDNSGPAWSPDGSLIACGVEKADAEGKLQYALVGVAVSDGKESLLTTAKWRTTQQVEWMPDGKGLLALAGTPQMVATQIWYISYPKGETRRVTNDLNYYSCVSITADGKTVATIRKEDSINLWLAPFAARAPAKRLTNGVARYREAIWTPDGKFIVDTDISGAPEFWQMEADGSQMKQLTFKGNNNQSPTLAADGRRLAYSSYRDGRFNIWLMDGDEASERQLTDSDRNFTPRFSPDDKWLVYATTDLKKWSVWKVAADGGGQPIQLAESNEACQPDISPDQKFIVYKSRDETSQKNIAVIIPFEGGQPVKTLVLPRTSAISARWSADGQGLIFIDTKGGSSELWYQPLDGGEAKQLTDLQAEGITSFTLSHDGKQIVAALSAKKYDAVLLKNLP
jgi:serine/threonine protein kinase/Tol biopolymer transport system component